VQVEFRNQQVDEGMKFTDFAHFAPLQFCEENEKGVHERRIYVVFPIFSSFSVR
jgi:hypothetical protein